MKSPFSTASRWPRVATGIVVAGTMVAGIVVGRDDPHDVLPGVRLHAGVAWVASNEVGQLTLLDGASAEVAAGVQVDQPGTALYAAQEGATGYALNRARGSVVRVDGATLEPSRSTSPVAQSGDQLAVFPTPHAFYALDTQRGLLAKADPKTMESQGKPYPLGVKAAQDGAVIDAEGRFWVLDEHTGDLVWFDGESRHSRAHAATPGESRLAIVAGRPVLLDPGRRTMALLDPETDAVEQAVAVDLRAGDTVAVTGSAEQHRLLISVSSRGLFLSCAFDSGSCAKPVSLGDGPSTLGQAVEVGNRAAVPDYSTGEVSIIDLTTSRVVARPRLFDRPVRFDLLTRDGVIFYNDPGSEQAGVIDPEGGVRPIVKYRSGQHLPGEAPTEAVSGPDGDTSPGEVAGDTRPGPRPASSVSISVSPRDRGVVGEEFEFAALATGGSGIAGARWTFGDGSGATGSKVRYRWNRPGSYQVSVTARLRQGQVTTATVRVVVEDPSAPPRIARISVEPEAPRAGRRVSFGADLTGGPPRRTEWTVTGDRGTETTSSAPRFGYTFTAPGEYTVTLTVSAGAASDRRTRRFTVSPGLHEVRCGDTVTADSIVTQDLVCPGAGLTIAAGNVVLDLGGHTISTDRPTEDAKGIVIGTGRAIRNITVRNGSISRYPTGIAMTDVGAVTVENVAVSASMAGTGPWAIVGERASEVRLRSVAVSAFHPFDFSHNSSVVMTRSIISGDTGRGVARCRHDSTCVVEGGSIHVYSVGCPNDDPERTSSSVSIVGSDDVSVAYLGPYCTTVTVRDSKINLLFDASATNTYLSGNTISQDESLALWNSFTIVENVFTGGGSSGIHVFSGKGVVSGNSFVRKQGNGVLVRAIGDDVPVGPLDISGNVFEGNGTGGDEWTGLDGIRVESAGPGSIIKVAGNHTRNNARYGINAEPGLVVDEGGNRTSGDPLGCRGVVCLPG
ncbi:PKD domain-containing protein [Amycolatopsis sp. MtRt-6]|uniref:PKD domain-containing protein n=1 Tax=Amycolatopsis sp. MtRt-6 TaxID=2792782 RepID=UPI001A8D8802|nr:PKD domain-containing protein [Amycolatopsis sp. MtRt-6]